MHTWWGLLHGDACYRLLPHLATVYSLSYFLFPTWKTIESIRLVATAPGAARRAAVANRARRACTGVLQCQRHVPLPPRPRQSWRPSRTRDAHARPTNKHEPGSPPTPHSLPSTAATLAPLHRRHPRGPPPPLPSCPGGLGTLAAVRDPRDAASPRRCGGERGRDRGGSRVAPGRYPHPSPAIAAAWDKPSQ
jgi:hypothetical protein